MQLTGDLFPQTSKVFTVAELTRSIRGTLETKFGAVALFDFLRQTCGQPVAPHHPSHRRIAFDPAQQVVFVGSDHGGDT